MPEFLHLVAVSVRAGIHGCCAAARNPKAAARSPPPTNLGRKWGVVGEGIAGTLGAPGWVRVLGNLQIGGSRDKLQEGKGRISL